MEINKAVQSFAALSQESRLAVFRLLLSAGENGLPAGAIATKLSIIPNTLSANLNILSQSGLVSKKREGRSIRYFADLEGVRSLLGFLMQDCCGGKPDLCQPALDAIMPKENA